MTAREGMDWAEFKEFISSIRDRLKNGDIQEDEARRRLRLLGFNATQIEDEIKSMKEEE